MNRPKDPALRQKILDRAVQHVLQHGVGGLSLRPMAKDIGTTARMLIHHFGSKEALVAEVLLAMERDAAQRAAAYIGENRGVSFTLERMWSDVAAPAVEPAMRAMFEVWGHALVHPTRYQSFLESLTEPWIDLLRRGFEQSGREPVEAEALATLAVGAFQGLQLVRLTSGNDRCSKEALRVLLRWIDPPAERDSSRTKRKRSL